MSEESAIASLNNYIISNHEPGISLWHIALVNDVLPNAKNEKLPIYKDAKVVFDTLVNNPQRKFETISEVDQEYNPLYISVWEKH